MLRNRRIAIVEDNEDYIYAVDRMMRRSGLLEDNLDIYSEISEYVDKGYDVVFTDLRLQETYGAETIRELRKKTKSPIVVLTGLGGSFMGANDMKILLDAGADEVFNKEIINSADFSDRILDIIKGLKP